MFRQWLPTWYCRLARRDRALADLRSALRAERALPSSGEAIANITLLHDAPDGAPFPFYAALAVCAAHRHHPAARLRVIAETPPHGPYWEALGEKVKAMTVAPFTTFGAARVIDTHHRMDIVRLLVLSDIGGICASSHMLTLRAMDELATHPLVLGAEARIPAGRLALGTGMAVAQPDNPLCRRWLAAYARADFRAGEVMRDHFARRLPARLYAEYCNEAHILPHNAWFTPLRPHTARLLFDSDLANVAEALVAGQYAVPLDLRTCGEELARWSPERLSAEDCLFARLGRLVWQGRN